MKFEPARIAGVVRIDIDPLTDERGFFARTWCADEFARQGLVSVLSQCSVSYNRLRGTLRGMHLQRDPWAEAKVVRCTRGAIYDVVVDLRRDSPTHRQWQAFELDADNRRMVYVPPGVAHGFQTLEDDTELHYQISERYVPDAAAGVRWNDPAFGIEWPLRAPILSPRDASWPDYA